MILETEWGDAENLVMQLPGKDGLQRAQNIARSNSRAVELPSYFQGDALNWHWLASILEREVFSKSWLCVHKSPDKECSELCITVPEL